MNIFNRATPKSYLIRTDYACRAETTNVQKALGPNKPRAELRKGRNDLLPMPCISTRRRQ